MFSILQWNANSLSSNGHEFKLNVDLIKPEIICIQESFLSEKQNFVISGYNCIRLDRTHHRCGGVATFIKNGIPYTIEDQGKDIEFLSISIKCNNTSYIISNVYIPRYHPTMKLDEVNKIFSKKNSIICGDFNGKNTIWGSPITDTWGNIIEGLLHENNLVVINNGSPTRFDFIDPSKHSHLDLTLVSSNLASISTWEVLDINCGSDHSLIKSTFGMDVYQEELFIPKWNFNKADWDKYKLLSEEYLLEITKQNIASIDEYNSKLISAINSAALLSIPKTKPCLRKPVPFWNEECSEAIKARKAAKNKVLKSRNPKHYIDYKQARARARRVIKQSKREYWEKFCSSLSYKSDINKVWKTIRNFNRAGTNHCSPQLKNNNIPIFDSTEKANIFAKQFSFVSSDDNYSQSFLLHKQKFESEHKKLFDKQPNNNSSFNENFTVDDLLQALSKCNNTSPGEDQICYSMFNHLSKKSLTILLHFFNKIWELGSLPQDWKLSIIIPLIKPGKDSSLASSYRPIALTPTLSKLMERMVVSRLTWYLESNNLININQSGFRKNRRTLDQLIRLSDNIQKAIAVKKLTLGVFLDIEKAYDMVWKKGILFKLNQMGISGNLFNWINDFLHNRYLKTRIGSKYSNKVNTDNGTPQGSTISPILFLIAINDLKINSNVQLSMFADDTAIWFSSKNVKFLQNKIQSALDDIHIWCNKWGFKISIAKTKAILFTNKRNHPKISLNFNNTPLNIVDKVKFLGIIFDSKLTWQHHIQYIVDKCKTRVNLLKCFSGMAWGPGKDTLCHIYKALIRSRIDYGCQIYATASKTQLHKLDLIQNLCLKICTRALKGTPISSLEVDCGVMPLDIRRLKLQSNIVLTYQNSVNNPVKECLQHSWWDDFHKSKNKSFKTLLKSVKDILDPSALGFNSVPTLIFPPWELFSPVIDTSLSLLFSKKDPSYLIKALSLEFINSWKGYLHIFTDGSKSREKSSAAFYIPDFKICKGFSISNNCNNFDTEIIAIIKALEWLENKNIFKCIIFSDSLSALQAIKSKNTSNSHLIQELFYWLYNLQNLNLSVSLAWIPGHVDIRGNDIADKTARNYVSNQIDIHIKNSKSFVNSSIDDIINNIWQDRWDCNSSGRFFYKIQKQVSEKVKFVDTIRSKETVISRLRYGHCFLNNTKFLFKRINSPNCDVCLCPETVQHFLLDCAKHHSLNLDLTFKLLSKNKPINIENILNDSDCIDIIWIYIYKNKIDI